MKSDKVNIKEIAAIGFFRKDGLMYPCAQIQNQNEKITINAPFVAASFVTLTNAFLDLIPEEDREKFANDVFRCYEKMIPERKKYGRTIENDNNQEPQV